MNDEFKRQAWAGLATGICIGLAITLAVGLVTVVLGQLCIVQGIAPWCTWPW